jgi:hypothetical protein
LKPAQDAGDPDKSLPEGDFRDWKEIEAWASQIAPTLQASADGAAPGQADHRAALTVQ